MSSRRGSGCPITIVRTAALGALPISVRADEGLLNELIAAPPETGPYLC